MGGQHEMEEMALFDELLGPPRPGSSAAVPPLTLLLLVVVLTGWWVTMVPGYLGIRLYDLMSSAREIATHFREMW